MELHSRKDGRITLTGPEFNIRSCTPGFFPPTNLNVRQLCPVGQPMQAPCPQVFSVEQPQIPPVLPHEAIHHHQDIEYITLPVFKTRKNEAPCFNQPEHPILDGRFHQEMDLRAFQNVAYPGIPEPPPPPFPYYYHQHHLSQPIHAEPCSLMAFQPPPRSPRGEARALVSQYYPRSPQADDNSAMLHRNMMMNVPGRKCASDIQLPIPFQWVDINQNKPKPNPYGSIMKTIPENPHKYERSDDNEQFQRATPIERYPDGNISKNSHETSSLYFSNRKFNSDPSVNKRSSTPIKYRQSRRNKCVHTCSDNMSNRHESPQKATTSRENHREAYISSLNLSTTSQSSIGSLSYYSTHKKTVKCSCSEESDHSDTKSGKMKYSARSRCSVGNQTDFIKTPMEEKFLFRETILFGCDEISKWARKLPTILELCEISEYIRNKTTQSRAQNICSADIEDRVVVTEYLKVFLKLADTWLEARNCFGLNENCTHKVCQLNNIDMAKNYLEWQHASMRLLGNIVQGVGSVIAQGEGEISNMFLNRPQNVPQYVFGQNDVPTSRIECRLTRSTSSLQKYYNNGLNTMRFPQHPNKHVLQPRQKWTISDTASNTSHCSSSLRVASHPMELNPPRYFHTEHPVHYNPAECPPIKIADIPQHKITLLSQIEPQCLRKQENTGPSVDISAWFSGKPGDVTRCVAGEENKNAHDMSRFTMPPPQIKLASKPFNLCSRPMNVQKSQSVTLFYAQNEGSQDSSDERQQKVYMKPGSYNVPRKKLTNAKKRTNVQKAKEACCGDSEIPHGFIIPFVNAGPFVPPPSRGLQNSNIKIVRKIAAPSDNLTDVPFRPDSSWKIVNKTGTNEEVKSQSPFEDQKKQTILAEAINNINLTPEKDLSQPQGNYKCKIPPKTMKTDEWLLTTLINSQVRNPEFQKSEQPTHNVSEVEQQSRQTSRNESLSQEGNEVRYEEKDQGFQAQDQTLNHSQGSSDKSSCGPEENANAPLSSRASVSVNKVSRTSRNVWHNSKRRRVLGQRALVCMEEILNQLWNHEVPIYIKQAVKPTQYSDYHKIVRYPIFLETITNKSKNKVYENVEQFIHDCRKLVFNALLYFGKDKKEAENIERFSENLEKTMEEYIENWDYWNHITGDPKEVHFFPELRQSNGKRRSRTPKGSRKDDTLG